MKTTLYAIFIFLLFIYSTRSYAQFIQVNSGTTEHLNAVFFTSTDIGYISGNNGIMLKTSDGGNSWNVLTTEVTNELRAVHFQSNNIGYSNALKTIDGGATWISFLDSTTHSGDANHITFVNDSVGFFAGQNDSKVYKTTDGGVSWSTTFLNSSMVFEEIVFSTDSIGFLVGWYPSSFWKTTDQGNSWSLISDALDLRSLFFTSDSIGYAAGVSGIYKTTDLGVSWVLSSIEMAYNMFCPDENICYALSNNESVLKTTNGGITWDKITLGVSNTLKGVFFTDNLNGIIVGNNGLILKTSNGGLSAERINQGKVGVNVFPNPFSESTTVNIEGLAYASNNTTLTLYNVLGEKVRTMPVKSPTFKIQKENLQQGVYFYQINNDSQLIANGKIVVE